jgi:hypothetical protein
MICGDAIGVCEPLVVIDSESARPASPAREPDLGDDGEILAHRYCTTPPTTASDDRARRASDPR